MKPPCPDCAALAAAVLRYRDSLRQGMRVAHAASEGYGGTAFSAAADQSAAAWRELVELAERVEQRQ